MIIPSQTSQRFDEEAQLRRIVLVQLRELFSTFCDDRGFAFLGRLKSIESTAEKIETGRFSKWSDIDDLVACTIVVPTIAHESEVLEFCESRLHVVNKRLRGSVTKSPDVFRFDATRIACRFKVPDGLEAAPDAVVATITFEVQIKTAFEYAWSVATHDLVYKSSQIDWRRLRLASQMKAAVEQLDILILAYGETSLQIPMGVFPEVERRKKIAERVRGWSTESLLPSEMAPKDYSRFAENLFSLLNSVGKADKTKQALNLIEKRIRDLGESNVPRSISIFQFVAAILIGSDFLELTDAKYAMHVTSEMEQLFPEINGRIPSKFDYES